MICFIYYLKPEVMKDYILINNSDKLFVIKFSRIIKITSNGNCCDIEDAEGSKCSVSKCLSKVYSELPPSQFIKVSQSCIINVQYLKHPFLEYSVKYPLLFTKTYSIFNKINNTVYF